MARLEDSRVMGNILRLMSKIMDEDKRTQETALVQPQPVKKQLYCRKMQMHVNVCRLTSCSLYAYCAGRHPSLP